jgi:hypothetical protein
MLRSFGFGFLAVITLLAGAFSQQPVAVSPTQVPNATAPGPQRHNPSAQAQPKSGVPRTAMAQPSTNLPAPYTGTIEGLVYWNASTISHKPAGSCDGISVTVSLGTPLGSSGKEEFKPLSTQSNNFKYVGKVGTYGVCTYGFNHVPVGEDVQVQVNVTTPRAFSPIVAAAVAITKPIKIINGKCNNLPPALPSPSDLTSQWWTCGNYAYNVNFVLQPPAHIMSTNSNNSGAALLTGSSSNQPTLLSNGPSRGMLESGAAAQAQGRGAVQGNSPGSAVQLNPQPLPPRGTSGMTAVMSPQRSPSAGGVLGTAPSPIAAGIQPASPANIGPAQTRSFQGGAPSATTALPTRAVWLSSGMPTQIAVACGKDSSFRILGVTGATYNSFMPSGKYTIWGCSFGSVANPKAQTPPRGQTQTVATSRATNPPQPNGIILYGGGSWPPFVVGANINSWNDNSITVTFPSASELAKSQYRWVPVQLWVVRGDGKTTAQDGYNFAFW